MHFIEPTFEIDGKNRVICQRHSSYPFFVMPGKTRYQNVYMEKILTCLTCSHYLDNECFFHKSEIDEIERNRLKKKRNFSCKLCGNKIDRMLTI